MVTRANPAERDDDEDEELEDEETEDGFVLTPLVSRHEAARLFKVTTKTVRRWVKEGFLQTDASGNLSRSEVMAMIARGNAPPVDPINDGNYYEELTTGLKIATSHSERLLSLIEKPLKIVTDGLLQMNQQLLERVQKADEQNLNNMQAMGEILMQQAEREAMAQKEAVKTALMAQTGETIINVLPTLLSQLLSKKAGAAKEFVSSLSDEEKEALQGAGVMFEGDKRAKFDALLSELGVAKKPEGTSHHAAS